MIGFDSIWVDLRRRRRKLWSFDSTKTCSSTLKYNVGSWGVRVRANGDGHLKLRAYLSEGGARRARGALGRKFGARAQYQVLQLYGQRAGQYGPPHEPARRGSDIACAARPSRALQPLRPATAHRTDRPPCRKLDKWPGLKRPIAAHYRGDLVQILPPHADLSDFHLVLQWTSKPPLQFHSSTAGDFLCKMLMR